jgi:hypothetical protein
MGRIVLAVIVGGLVMIYKGYQEWRLSGAASDTPQEMTCAELAAYGPGDNANIVLTDYVIAPNFIYQEKNGVWQTVWCPVVSTDSPYVQEAIEIESAGGNAPPPPVDQVKVIFKSGKVRRESQLDALQQRSIQGLVVNQIDSIDGKAKNVLLESYPGLDVESCWIFEPGRTPTRGGAVLGWMGGGATLAVLGAGLGLRGFRSA